MSGVYIKGLWMPKDPDEFIEIAIFGDGKVIQTGESWRNLENGKCYYTPNTPEKLFNAVPVPPHGGLIDRDEIKWIEEEFEERCHNDRWTVVEKIAYKAQVDKLPTIIPAEPPKEETCPTN